MKNKRPDASETQALDDALAAQAQTNYILRLYVIGTRPHSARAVVNLRKICENHLRGRYDLEVVDISQNPALAIGDQILAAPTLIKESPLPRRRLIGDLSQPERVLAGLGIPRPEAA